MKRIILAILLTIAGVVGTFAQGVPSVGGGMVPNSRAAGTLLTSLRNVAVGDSLTVGAGVTPYGYLIAQSLGSFSSNQGISGDGWCYNVGTGNLTTIAPTTVDPLLNALGPTPPYLDLFAGTNDIVTGGLTGAQTYACFQIYIGARLTAGWPPSRIIVVTMLPRNSVETDRAIYNTALVAGAATYGYALARLDLDPNIGCVGCNTNLTYYQADQVHLNATGQQIVANLICGQMYTGSKTCPVY